MSHLESDEDVLAEATRIAAAQVGGTLATVHSEDGTPYVTFVLFQLRDDGSVLFGSRDYPQHARNIRATPEVSFLIDNRDVITIDWRKFDRIVIEGRAERIDKSEARYEPLMAELRAKNPMAATFTERGDLYCIHPRRLILRVGIEPEGHIVDFQHD
jgi:nitroimidazol reductase NimA-like FMN-containing flavoprotein (pyridoxamine 5'-phosphate oxidase superfamily)